VTPTYHALHLHTPHIGAQALPTSTEQGESLNRTVREVFAKLAMTEALLLKPWSPMSVGAWGLVLFGSFSFLSFLAGLGPHGRLARRTAERVRLARRQPGLLGVYLAELVSG